MFERYHCQSDMFSLNEEDHLKSQRLLERLVRNVIESTVQYYRELSFIYKISPGGMDSMVSMVSMDSMVSMVSMDSMVSPEIFFFKLFKPLLTTFTVYTIKIKIKNIILHSQFKYVT